MLRKIKKALLQSPIVLAVPLRTRLEERPCLVTILSPDRFALDKVQKIALGLLVIPAGVVFVTSLFSAQWTLFFITGFILLLVGFMVWTIKLRSRMVWKVTWHEDVVEVEDGRYSSADRWIEPLAAFTGLAQDFAFLRARSEHEVGRQIFGLFLTHPDPFKSILLYTNDKPIAGNEDVIAYYEAQLSKKFLGPNR